MADFVAGESKIRNYRLIQQIGSGSFASVWLATNEITKIRVAIKIIPKKSLESNDARTRFTREVSLLKQISHPFIAEFFEFIEDEKYYYIVVEYVENGNMLDFINNHGRISEPQARRYFSQIICVLEYLHKEKFVAHRDLKAENVLLDKYGNIRIIDFGLSNVFTLANPKLSTACGSPAYAAPEMIKGQQYTNAADIWSSGILLYSMVAGKLPFDDANTQRLLQKIVYTDVHFPPFFSPPLIDLLKKILSKDPETRLTIDRIKEHVWFSQSEYISLLQLKLKENHITSTIDKEIVDKISRMGVDTRALYESILTNEFTELTGIYRMLAKQKATEQMKDLMQKIQTNTPVQQPALGKYGYSFGPNNQQPSMQPREQVKVSFNAAVGPQAPRRQSIAVPGASMMSMTNDLFNMSSNQASNMPNAGMSMSSGVNINNGMMSGMNNNTGPVMISATHGSAGFGNFSNFGVMSHFQGINSSQSHQAGQPNGGLNGMRVMQVPAPAQIAARRLSRPVAVKRTIDLPGSSPAPRHSPHETP
ncbi:SNF1-related protein kinase catalytic subunit alpha KIN11 [Tritrichomonas foetus]|uniref:non-specific serine/threonine protein kinase n=1 Tax=Tritrichomonas foetus TaxID=1144522 RepID=A0A1J4KKC1_9EUKA|nr:SNF1-related protein kinase catalytic subunit alpha KIN11 [Tritrichomonas foetus]|eukprot:OHT10126.1 SNF1-related protein kinase catalytic subunit alpha KIN11 [Tritrichomonas foetus]